MSKTAGKKRKGIEKMAHSSISDSPKRGKVHAQRKFAQGVGLTSPISPFKEKEAVSLRPASPPLPPPPPPMILPKTTSFLDYVCYRRSPLLAHSLTLFKEVAVNSSKSFLTPAQVETTVKKNDSKREEKKSAPSGVQALKKKYQEQRMARAKASNVTTLAKKVKGKNMVRTRAATVVDEVVSKKVSRKLIKGRLGLRSGLQRTKTIAIAAKQKKKKEIKKKLERVGLRSGGSVGKSEQVKPQHVVKTKKQEAVKKPKLPVAPINVVRRKQMRMEKAEIGSDFSSDDNEPLLAHQKIKADSRVTRAKRRPILLQGGVRRPSRHIKDPSVLIAPRRIVSPKADDELSSADTTPDRLVTKKIDKKKNVTQTSSSVKSFPTKKPLPKSISTRGSPLEAEKTKQNDDKIVEKKAKIVQRKGSQSDRPATRSRRLENEPIVKKELPVFKKPAIRSLIQKKKLNSLRTLTRLGNSKKAAATKDNLLGGKIMENKEAPKLAKVEKNGSEVGSDGKKKKVETNTDIKKPTTSKDLQKSDSLIEQDNIVVSGEKEDKKVIFEGPKLRGKSSESTEIIKSSLIKELKLPSLAKAKLSTEQIQKKALKKPKQVIEVSVGGLSKRPPRKCSTIDKIWIDIDGFTSDEDDFVDLDSIAFKTKKASEKLKECKPKRETIKDEDSSNLDDNNCLKLEDFSANSSTFDILCAASTSGISKTFIDNAIAKERMKLSSVNVAKTRSTTLKTTSSLESCDTKQRSKTSSYSAKPVPSTSKPSPPSTSKPSPPSTSKPSPPSTSKPPPPLHRISDSAKKSAGSINLQSQEKPIEIDSTGPAQPVFDVSSQLVPAISDIPTKAQVEDSHALIATLAASLSVTSKPTKHDTKAATKDLTVSCTKNIKDESQKEVNLEDLKIYPIVEDKKDILLVEKPCYNSLASEVKEKTVDISMLNENSITLSENKSNLPHSSVAESKKRSIEKPISVAKVLETRLAEFEQSRHQKTIPIFERNRKEIRPSFRQQSIEPKDTSPSHSVEVVRENQVEKMSNKKRMSSGLESDSSDDSGSSFSPKIRKSAVEETAIDRDNSRKRSEKGGISKAATYKSEKSGKKSEEENSRRARPIRPRSTAQAITRRERPRRLCSAVGKAWIERDSDDSSFYQSDDEQHVLELIRKSELEAEKEKKRAMKREKLKSPSVSSKENVDSFSDSDDEPLKKKPSTLADTALSSASQISEPVTKNLGGKSETPKEGNISVGVLDLEAVVPQAVRFIPPPREPINTHGLDLLSEVVTLSRDAAVDNRVEQWLKDSIRNDSGKGFIGFDESEIRQPPIVTVPKAAPCSIPNPLVEFFRTPSETSKPKHSDDPKKVIKKPLEPFLKRPPVSSVQDLLKLQKVRKESIKPVSNLHSNNCKCNSCVVKKAWFKNKPMPGETKSTPARESSPVKPFQTLSKAFAEAGTSAALVKASASVAPFIANKDSPENKVVSPQRKLSFLERMRERERKEAMAKPHPNAFSPINESSVYAFVPEPERKSTPFRSPTLSRTSSTSALNEETVEESKHQSNSIAVQVNFDSAISIPSEPSTALALIDDGKSMEISTQTDGAEDDPDSPMFYIPLQQACGATQPVIQGVALKLGTEGPLGPNQRVIMKAQLVTQNTSVPSVKAVVMPQKKMFANPKNAPPVGTVQPTTRRPPEQTDAIGPIATKTRKANKTEEAKNTPSEVDTKVQSKHQLRGHSPSPSSNAKRLMTNPILTPKEPKKADSMGRDTAKSRTPVRDVGKSGTPTRETGKSATPLREVSNSCAMLTEAPTFHLTEKEFQDPLEFFERIRPMAERFGLCRIVPPSSFKPDCKVTDDMRFTAYNQYVHRMFHRWGPNAKETMAMKKYLKTQSISLKPPPCVGGMEVDLPRLFKAVQTCGGLMKVMEKQKWHHVADMLRIPKAAHDRGSKLDSIYCQYLLPYDTLKPEERRKLLEDVESDWKTHQEKSVAATDIDGDDEGDDYIEECDECIVKGRSMALNQFYRIARNTMSMWFKSPEPSPAEVEEEFWKHVSDRMQHICVHSGSIDSSGWGYGFPVSKSNFAKHPWNLKVLTNNSGSVLRSLGPVMGVTVPTLHVGMVFTAFCWYRDPHGLPWVEYLHTGAPKIWYGISDDNCELFRSAVTQLLPRHTKEKRIWLPCDTAMAPPEKLAKLGVPLCRTTQEPGQFVLVFPRAFTSSICSGYLVSESVYFARPSWLQTAEQVFRDIHDSAEPSGFSLDNLLFSIAGDSRASLDVLQQVLPMVRRVRERELDGRVSLEELGISSERLLRDQPRRRKGTANPEPDYECETCRASLFLSLVSNAVEETVFCLQHGLQQLRSQPQQLSSSKLLYSFDQDEINQVVEKLEEKIGAKLQKGNKK